MMTRSTSLGRNDPPPSAAGYLSFDQVYAAITSLGRDHLSFAQVYAAPSAKPKTQNPQIHKPNRPLHPVHPQTLNPQTQSATAPITETHCTHCTHCTQLATASIAETQNPQTHPKPQT
jgi:hypothetical protein